MATVGAQYHSSGNGTMSASSGVSRLSMMQARLREQLMLDKESRLLQMAARREEEQEGTIKRVTKSSGSTLSSSLASLSSLNSSMGGPGRVRQMFQERRSNGYGTSPVGRDKSYPLEPVRSGGSGGGGGGRPPVKPVKGVVRNRGVSVDRGKAAYDPEAMRRSRSHAAFQNHANNNGYTTHNAHYNGDQRSPARVLRPPQGRQLQHHKSTSSLLDANQNYNGRASSSSSGVYSRGPSRDPSPAPSPSHNANRFGFRGPPSRGASPAPPARTSPVTSPSYASRPQPPPRQRPSPPPRQPPRQPVRQPVRPARNPSVRNSSPPDDVDSTSIRNTKSKAPLDGPPITQVKSFKATPLPSTPSKPTLAPKPKTTAAAPSQQAPRQPKPVPGLASCKICGRNFAPDRIEKHEVICSKSQAKAKKRKVFDPVKMRTKGTEAEKYVSKGRHLQDKPKPKKKDWKKQHEDFIATIRAAKTGTEAPPIDNSDYVECPHCHRKFSEDVADRHIPKCANISSNKPPPLRRRR